ncbi:hypothetical protein [Alkalitalea saponilacus]|uniref:Uncharacterized protein n=1 Tax=Alkalitalea saponilacus TaxID=889453 RepID=A0A1T5G933_9BACT|nr:hypothetical protein [Alkalitalea saponilacus]ASB47895.1 hypothetical protein CDL62_01380 [Alkalitalea saponilacus]SKC04926.1 hypothetical protein SAMN03080601_01777 [Alkalitalea saponilacus]
MEYFNDQMANAHILNQFWLTFLLVISMVLVSRTFVAGTRYSPILIIVVFGLIMGYVMVSTGMGTPGLREFPIIDFASKVTITALSASFFVGGQEIRKLISNQSIDNTDIVEPSADEMFLGTKFTQFMFLIRAFFIMIGVESLKRTIIGYSNNEPLDNFYPLLGYIGVVGSIILIDYRAKITNKPVYIRKGMIETGLILSILVLAYYIATWIRPIIALPEIFFAMILSVTLGMLFSRWKFGPTIRSLLFAGIPVVLAANFMVGGSRIAEAFSLTGMTSVLSFGFFGQLVWMFGGLTLLIVLGHANHMRNLAPGMAGSLSHSGLTGACTAGDLGYEAQLRAPIMINIPFIGHIFVFSILAASATSGKLLIPYTLLIVAIGMLLTWLALRTLKTANSREKQEIRGLMIFSLGWQLVAVFGGLLILNLGGMGLNDSVMANASAISHFGLFAAIQGGMFGEQAAGMIAFVFAMPFLVHPLVFGIFGKTAENNGVMPVKIVFILAAIGILGVLYALVF